MSDQPNSNLNLILSVGTQVVTLVEVRGTDGKPVHPLPYIGELVDRKLSGPEKSMLPEGDWAFHQSEYGRLREELQKAFEVSRLPEAPSGQAALNDLLIRVRIGGANRDM